MVLGGTALEKVKRHPTIEDGVIIGSGASVLGPITVGKGARIGAGAVVVRPVPPGATVVGVPGRIAGPECAPKKPDSVHGDMPDPMLRVISRLLDRQNQLEKKVRSLEQAKPAAATTPLPEDILRENQVRDALKEVIDPEVDRHRRSRDHQADPALRDPVSRSTWSLPARPAPSPIISPNR